VVGAGKGKKPSSMNMIGAEGRRIREQGRREVREEEPTFRRNVTPQS
jgi:hypothetical protein